ncbi:luciferase family protein [Planotetraspora sp. GP83]|uniref:luciferase domain-containing protein n=1 Tax=Planotetraspora sp. GP83 TaxID=3156264 RepID=UPI003513B1BE
MSVTGIARQSVASRVLTQLEAWPGCHAGHAACGSGLGVTVGARQILHLHTDREAELCLTRPVIERMRHTLETSEQVALEPHRDWIGVRLETENDADLLVALFSLAIKAHQGPEPGPGLTDCLASGGAGQPGSGPGR